MSLTHIASVTASASATVAFTSGIDSTYNEYQFHFANMHPATDNVEFLFQVNASGQTGFNEVMTTTAFYVYKNESDSVWVNPSYDTSLDQAQATGYQPILAFDTGNDNDQSTSGIMTLYDPSSTTYVKHFAAVGFGANASDYVINMFNAGYINTTAAIDEISFKFDSGNIDAGSIHMYGVG